MAGSMGSVTNGSAVAALFVREGFELREEWRGIPTWCLSVGGTDDFVSILYDKDSDVGDDLTERKYLIGRYSRSVLGYRQLCGYITPAEAIRAGWALVGFSENNDDDQIDIKGLDHLMDLSLVV